jgi:site-specific DNA-cytosine methylase
MKILELFSGTKSVSKAFPDDEIVSLDIISKHQPTIVCDIMEWNYKEYPPGSFDIIWASPPCIEYSILKHNTKMPTDLTGSDAIVKKTIEIIQ